MFAHLCEPFFILSSSTSAVQPVQPVLFNQCCLTSAVLTSAVLTSAVQPVLFNQFNQCYSTRLIQTYPNTMDTTTPPAGSSFISFAVCSFGQSTVILLPAKETEQGAIVWLSTAHRYCSIHLVICCFNVSFSIFDVVS